MRLIHLFEMSLDKIEADALIILEAAEKAGTFKKATSSFPHPSAANAWAQRDGLNPKKVMKIWELILQLSGNMDIAYNMPHFINAYKSIDTVHAAQVKKRVASDNKTRTHTKKSIDEVIASLEKSLKAKK